MSETHDTTIFVRDRLDELRHGRADALGELLARVQERSLVLTQKMLRKFPRLRRWVEPEDVLQEANIRLLDALRSTECQDPLSFYRLTSLKLRQQLIDLARKYQGPLGPAHNHDSVMGRDDGHDPAATLEAPEDDDPARLARWTEFHAQVDALPEEHRILFDLLWYQGLKQVEAAGVLGVTEKTIQRNWQKARYALAAQVGPEGSP